MDNQSNYNDMHLHSISTQVIRSRRGMQPRLHAALFAILIVGTTAIPKAVADYTFTLIADSAGPFSGFGAVPSPSINASGTVGFFASLDNGSSGVFKGNGGSVTTIGINATAFGGTVYPVINQAGTVAFFASNWNNTGQRIVAGNGGSLVTIADTTGPFKNFASGYSVSINTAGAVAFWAAQKAGSGGVFLGDGATTTPIQFGVPFSFAFNDAGTLGYTTGNGTGVRKANGGTVTTVADGSGLLKAFSYTPAMNQSGTVAFAAGLTDTDGDVLGIYTGNGGPLTTIADTSGPFGSFSNNDFYSSLFAINDSGTVAFAAGLDAGGYGIYTGNGGATSKVIGTGDSLFGSAVTGLSISPTAFNDSGQLALIYSLANGTTGIALATPTPEPSASLLLATGALLALRRRRR